MKDFVLEGFKKFQNEPMFGFNILHHKVVVMKGEQARKAFYERKDLSFHEGYRLLFGGGPEMKDVVKDFKVKNDQEQASWVMKRLLPLLHPERMAQLTPLFMSDIGRNLAKWEDSGKIDPFVDIYSVVFQFTVRAGACREIADSVELCKKIEDIFWAIDEGATPTAVLFPWLPSPARHRKIQATIEAFNWFDQIIKARQAENRREDDAMQMLLDMGHSTGDVIEIVLFVLFAAIINTGLMSAWLFVYLDQALEWRAKVVAELDVLLNKYAPLSIKYATPAERFSSIPPDAWENELPVLDDCIRETIRRAMATKMIRRVTGGDIKVAGKSIPNGTYLVYSAGEVHNDPAIYPNPEKFDPGRWSRGEDKAQTYGFLGWGVGRHPCTGRRFALYEIKTIVGTFLATYDYEVVNSEGNRRNLATVLPDWNNMHQARPAGKVLQMIYRKRDS